MFFHHIQRIWMAFVIIFLNALAPTQAQDILCDTGEVLHWPTKKPLFIVRALKDGPTVYAEDKSGNLYSFKADQDHRLEQTNVFRLPVIGTIWNIFISNKLKPTFAPTGLNPWAISHTTYEQSNQITISVFEMTNSYPIQIRNRDPWLCPLLHYMHQGPLGMVGVDITAIDRWVVVSGYTLERKKVFALREMNYDLAGHNFLMHYILPEGAVKPNAFLHFLSKKVDVSQEPVTIPRADWRIFPLPQDSQPRLLLKKVEQEGILRTLLEIPHEQSNKRSYFDITTQQYVGSIESPLPYTGSHWPLPELMSFVLETQPSLYKNATLNDEKGIIELSSQEPLYGTFQNAKGQKTDVYAILKSPWDFFTNRLSYVDKTGKTLTFRLTH